MTAKLATGEIQETTKPPSGNVRSGKAGAKKRMENLSTSERKIIATQAAKERWKHKKQVKQ